MDSTAGTDKSLQVKVGELLAKGFTNGEILAALQEEDQVTLEIAQTTLRGVFDCWTSVHLGLNIQDEDERNWHHHLRMKLLQKVLGSEETPSLRLALNILDSLAAVQGITTTVEHMVPLPIFLVPKEITSALAAS